MMLWLLGLVCFIVLVIVLYLNTLPKTYQVVRSQEVPLRTQAALDHLLCFKHWPLWSPWVLHDAATQMEFWGEPATVGSGYGWKSTKIGEGRMDVTAIHPNAFDYTLHFLKPFKANAQGQFTAHALTENTTRITWSMQAQLPLFLRPFQWFFERSIGKDFELGLARWVGVLNPALPHPQLRFLGVVDRAAQTVVYRSYSGNMADISTFMRKAMPEVQQEAGQYANAPAMSLSHKANLKHETIVMDAAMPVDTQFSGAPTKTVAGGKYYHVQYQGDYAFLPIVWNAAMGHVRMEKLKYDNSRAHLEVYMTDMDQQPDSNQWITDIYIAVKS